MQLQIDFLPSSSIRLHTFSFLLLLFFLLPLRLLFPPPSFPLTRPATVLWESIGKRIANGDLERNVISLLSMKFYRISFDIPVLVSANIIPHYN